MAIPRLPSACHPRGQQRRRQRRRVGGDGTPSPTHATRDDRQRPFRSHRSAARVRHRSARVSPNASVSFALLACLCCVLNRGLKDDLSVHGIGHVAAVMGGRHELFNPPRSVPAATTISGRRRPCCWNTEAVSRARRSSNRCSTSPTAPTSLSSRRQREDRRTAVLSGGRWLRDAGPNTCAVSKAGAVE